MTYEGWTNYETWTVALWLNNHYPLYQRMVEYLKNNLRDGKVPVYGHMLTYMEINRADRAGDDVPWWSDAVNRTEIEEMLLEQQNELREYA